MATGQGFGTPFFPQGAPQATNRQLNTPIDQSLLPPQPLNQLGQQPPIGSIPQAQGGFGPLGPLQGQQQPQQMLQQQPQPQQLAPGQATRFGRRRPRSGGLTPSQQTQPVAQAPQGQQRTAPTVNTRDMVRRALQEQLGLTL